VSQLIKVLPGQASHAELEERLSRLERAMLDVVIIAFEAFSAGSQLWMHCMQIGAEINAREAAALAKQQRTRSKRLPANRNRAKEPNGVKPRIALRPVRRAASV
jgi:hypothetical protein